MARASYRILRSTDDLVVLEDLDGQVSVMVDADTVVEEVLQRVGGRAQDGTLRRIYCSDAMGRVDELLHDGLQFITFAPVPRLGTGNAHA